MTSVSLAMRGSKRISLERTKQIRELADKMGYTPDPMMSALCAYRDLTRPRNKNTNINFLQFSQSSQKLKNQGEVAGDFWRGAQRETKQLGYNLNKIWAGDPSLTPERLKKILNSRGISGLIIYEANSPISYFESTFKDFSSVWLGDGPKGVNLHSVRMNRFSSMKIVWNRLCQLGYENGGLVMSDHNLDQNYGEWEAAHNHFQRKFVGQTNYIPPLTFKSKTDCNKQELSRWIDKWQPQVVISTFRTIYQLLRELGLSIPNEMGYVSLTRLFKKEIVSLGKAIPLYHTGHRVSL